MSTPHEPVYRMGNGKLIPVSEMKQWHNDQGLPWGETFDGPDPLTISRMVPAGTSRLSLSVHLANEHKINPDNVPRGLEIKHMYAHMTGRFRPGQEHYHGTGESS